MIIISSKPGQLGNSLWLFASFIAFSVENDVKIYNPAFESVSKYFKSTYSTLFYTYPVSGKWLPNFFFRKYIYSVINILTRALIKSKVKIIPIVHLQSMETNYNMEDPDNVKQLKKNILLAFGWTFNADRLIAKHKDKITDYFTPLDTHRTNINTLLSKARNNSDMVIGIHIRRGDYNTFEGGRYFYSHADYRNLIYKTKELFQNKKVTFLICSNEKINTSDYKGIHYIPGTGQEIEDLYSFAGCDYLIGPPSTFTMWASFYGNVPLFMMKTSQDHPKSIKEFESISS